MEAAGDCSSGISRDLLFTNFRVAYKHIALLHSLSSSSCWVSDMLEKHRNETGEPNMDRGVDAFTAACNRTRSLPSLVLRDVWYYWIGSSSCRKTQPNNRSGELGKIDDKSRGNKSRRVRRLKRPDVPEY